MPSYCRPKDIPYVPDEKPYLMTFCQVAGLSFFGPLHRSMRGTHFRNTFSWHSREQAGGGVVVEVEVTVVEVVVGGGVVAEAVPLAPARVVAAPSTEEAQEVVAETLSTRPPPPRRRANDEDEKLGCGARGIGKRPSACGAAAATNARSSRRTSGS